MTHKFVTNPVLEIELENADRNILMEAANIIRDFFRPTECGTDAPNPDEIHFKFCENNTERLSAGSAQNFYETLQSIAHCPNITAHYNEKGSTK